MADETEIGMTFDGETGQRRDSRLRSSSTPPTFRGTRALSTGFHSGLGASSAAAGGHTNQPQTAQEAGQSMPISGVAVNAVAERTIYAEGVHKDRGGAEAPVSSPVSVTGQGAPRSARSSFVGRSRRRSTLSSTAFMSLMTQAPGGSGMSSPAGTDVGSPFGSPFGSPLGPGLHSPPVHGVHRASAGWFGGSAMPDRYVRSRAGSAVAETIPETPSGRSIAQPQLSLQPPRRGPHDELRRGPGGLTAIQAADDMAEDDEEDTSGSESDGGSATRSGQSTPSLTIPLRGTFQPVGTAGERNGSSPTTGIANPLVANRQDASTGGAEADESPTTPTPGDRKQPLSTFGAAPRPGESDGGRRAVESSAQALSATERSALEALGFFPRLTLQPMQSMQEVEENEDDDETSDDDEVDLKPRNQGQAGGSMRSRPAGGTGAMVAADNRERVSRLSQLSSDSIASSRSSRSGRHPPPPPDRASPTHRPAPTRAMRSPPPAPAPRHSAPKRCHTTSTTLSRAPPGPPAP